MKIGIFLGTMTATEGGGHTLLHDQLSALGRIRKTCGHELVLCHYNDGEELARTFPEFPRLNIDAERVHVLTEDEKLYERQLKELVIREEKYQWLPHVLRHVRYVLFLQPPKLLSQPKLSWEDRVYQRAGIQFLIRLVPWLEGITMDVPFAMTVWDLQHRASPWFPEVSSSQEWQRRERGYQEILRRASVLYTGTKTGRNEVTSYYSIPPERIHVLPFVTPTFAREAADRPRQADRLKRFDLPADYLFYPAQFWPHKNHVVVLEACRIVRERTGWNLGVVFSGSDKGNIEYVREYARRLGLEGVTRFPGFVDRAELVELYKSAFCMVFPTFFGPDNLPPLEAFALGCPVIASDVPGAREQLGDAARLFPPKDEHALAQAIMDLRDPAAREQLVSAGHRVAERGSWDEYAAQMLKAVDEFSAIRRTWA
ncbi:MAG TPA: glycosyltransferase family 1 protein [Xanthobacteraceae bacterium]|nr:glycosyltransferase family 1 protein [Xanthobacteraceae bacterium]